MNNIKRHKNENIEAHLDAGVGAVAAQTARGGHGADPRHGRQQLLAQLGLGRGSWTSWTCCSGGGAAGGVGVGRGQGGQGLQLVAGLLVKVSMKFCGNFYNIQRWLPTTCMCCGCGRSV